MRWNRVRPTKKREREIGERGRACGGGLQGVPGRGTPTLVGVLINIGNKRQLYVSVIYLWSYKFFNIRFLNLQLMLSIVV